jgi:glucose-1-phosphate thymidylyltransferase
MADAMRVGFAALSEDHTVVVLAGDNIILDDRNVKNTIDLVKSTKSSTDYSKLAWTFLELSPDEARHFSVYQELSGGKARLIEKPKDPPSKICWCGPVAFSSSFDALKRIETLAPSSRGEYEATDLMNTYLINGESTHIRLLGKWFDVGTPESLKEARREGQLLMD